MSKKQVEEFFYVECLHCGTVFQVFEGNELFEEARKSWESGRLDAIGCYGTEHGCVSPKPPKRDPGAPYRVFGYNDFFEEFDLPYHDPLRAVAQYLLRRQEPLLEVFISGLPDEIDQELRSKY